MPENGANVRQRKVARTLREWRKSKGATQDDVAKQLRWSVPKLSRYERADTVAGPAEIIAIGTVLHIDEEERDRLVRLAMASFESGWWSAYSSEVVRGDFEDYLEVEAAATKLRSFEIHLVPGLLQTADYYDAILRGGVRAVDDELAQARTQLRRQRQARLDHEDHPLTYHAIVHESALQLPIGGAEVMREQLDFLLARSELGNVTVQVLPIDAGAYPGIGTAYHLVTFGPDHAEGVYLENLHDGLYVEEDEEIEVYTLAFERLERRALPADASADRIAEIRDSWGPRD
ncbi:helix-turn-helix domain-containing protein [Saccharopolyspora rosea]|uniref:helix-turn-helix domain-containing protein n=1 Tax=Saccharopolyspora rosea TaxID=524884 RepID=UPI0021DB6809|nr:helix-turn-helix transcriptional regulator [Saccharopolyspora rosea]